MMQFTAKNGENFLLEFWKNLHIICLVIYTEIINTFYVAIKSGIVRESS